MKSLTFPLLLVLGSALYVWRPRVAGSVARFAALTLPFFEVAVALAVYWPEQQVHRALGHWLVAWVCVVCARFAGISIARVVVERRGWSSGDVVLSVAVVLFALLSAVSAYTRGDIQITPESELRFRVLHVVVAPALTLLASVALAFRGWRYDRPSFAAGEPVQSAG